LNELQYVSEDTLDMDTVLSYLEHDVRPLAIETIQLVKNHKEVQFHLDIVNNQRDVYNMNCIDKDLLKNHILIDMDFKMKVRIG
jgi:hypothetical protein